MDIAEQEQIAMIKHWWGDHGRKVIILVVTVFVVIFGWKYWQQNQIEKKTQASEAFFMLSKSIQTEDFEEFEVNARTVIRQYADTPYASLAAFMLAHWAVEQQHPEEAIEQLRWVADKASASIFQDIARVRLARLYSSAEEYNSALAELNQPHSKVFDALVNELKGDIYLEQHETTLAIASYQEALASEPAGLEARQPFILMKLNDLGESFSLNGSPLSAQK
jgi:predicted negative regulator of RcsB-dependent stress response